MTDWKNRHREGLMSPRGDEALILDALDVLGSVAKRWKDDAVMLRVCVQPMASGVAALLNGPTGRLDAGTLDTQIRDIVESAGGDASEI